MQALIISVYSEYEEQQRNGFVRYSNFQNTHVGDVYQVKTFNSTQWWIQPGFYHEVVKTSGNRLKDLFPIKVMTQFNLPCELQCTEISYALESEVNHLYIIPTDHLSSDEYDHRPQPRIDQKIDTLGKLFYISEIKIKWKLIYDDPNNVYIPPLTHEHNFLKTIKEIHYAKREEHTSKLARILTAYVDFTKELDVSRQHKQSKLNDFLVYEDRSHITPTWESENLLCLKFDNCFERNQIHRTKKNRQAKRKTKHSGEPLQSLPPLIPPRPPTPYPFLTHPTPCHTPEPITPIKKPFIINEDADRPERPQNPLSKSYKIDASQISMSDDEEEDEHLTPEQIHMISLEEKAWKKVEVTLAQRIKQRGLPDKYRQMKPAATIVDQLDTTPDTVKKVIRQHICPLDNRQHDCPKDVTPR